MYEIKLADGQIYRGKIVYRDDTAIRLRLANDQKLILPYNSIIFIKDLGWQKIKWCAK